MKDRAQAAQRAALLVNSRDRTEQPACGKRIVTGRVPETIVQRRLPSAWARAIAPSLADGSQRTALENARNLVAVAPRALYSAPGAACMRRRPHPARPRSRLPAPALYAPSACRAAAWDHLAARAPACLHHRHSRRPPACGSTYVPPVSVCRRCGIALLPLSHLHMALAKHVICDGAWRRRLMGFLFPRTRSELT
jgi:hypothetical protein